MANSNTKLRNGWIALLLISSTFFCNPTQKEEPTDDPLVSILLLAQVSAQNRGNLTVDVSSKCGTGVTCTQETTTGSRSTLNFNRIHFHQATPANTGTEATGRSTTIVLGNSGNQPVILGESSNPTEFSFSPSTSGLTINPGESRDLVLTCTPRSRILGRISISLRGPDGMSIIRTFNAEFQGTSFASVAQTVLVPKLP